jgi:hypothetical protein
MTPDSEMLKALGRLPLEGKAAFVACAKDVLAKVQELAELDVDESEALGAVADRADQLARALARLRRHPLAPIYLQNAWREVVPNDATRLPSEPDLQLLGKAARLWLPKAKPRRSLTFYTP